MDILVDGSQILDLGIVAAEQVPVSGEDVTAAGSKVIQATLGFVDTFFLGAALQQVGTHTADEAALAANGLPQQLQIAAFEDIAVLSGRQILDDAGISGPVTLTEDQAAVALGIQIGNGTVHRISPRKR